MSERHDGGPAFPTGENANPHNPNPGRDNGMSLRDYFAAQALSGILAATRGDVDPIRADLIVKGSYFIADQMLEERKS